MAGCVEFGLLRMAGRPASATAARRDRLRLLIAEVFTGSDGTYGHRRVHAQLARWGEQASLELVRAAHARAGPGGLPAAAVAAQPDRGRRGAPAPIPDLVRRDFTADAPGLKMVGDITYIPTWEGWVYLATVIDCHTKQVLGWAIDDNYKTPLISAAIGMAARNQTWPPVRSSIPTGAATTRPPSSPAILSGLDIRQSVGRTGICYDNAMAESFFAALKTERVHRTQYPTREHARRDIARYIELHYNTRRLHSALGYKTPQEVHDEYRNRQAAV